MTLMNKLFFAESKLILLGPRTKSPENTNDVDQAVEGMLDGSYSDTREAQKVIQEQSKLRSRLAESDIFSDEDKKEWEKRIQEAKQKAISAEEMQDLTKEFEKQQGAIKGMVEVYTDKVMGNKESAFTVDSSRNLDTAKDYVDWFAKQSYAEKIKALNLIDVDIQERIKLRKKLLERFDKKEVMRLRRSEMKDKVKQLEQMEKNEVNYSDMMKGNEKYFHNPKEYLKQFKDQTLEEQARWLRVFKEEYLKPRKAVVDVYDRLPKEYKKDEKFLKIGLKEKQDFLDKLDADIQQKYIEKVNKVKPEIMSQNSKRFAIVDFLRLKDVAAKAMWLDQLPKSIEAEEKLVKEFKELRKGIKLHDPDSKKDVEVTGYSEKDWEKLKYEEKEQLLKSLKVELKLIEPFKKIIKEAIKDKAISEKTGGRYIKLYTDGKISERSSLCRNILTSMKIRRDLVDDFEKLDDETKKKFASFYKRGHKARVQLYQEAILFEKKNKIEEDDVEEKAKEEKEAPKALESDEILKIIAELHEEADALEAQGDYERCLDKHKYVLKLDSENEYSKKKSHELENELKTLDSIMDEEILQEVEKQAQMGSMQEELKQIQISRMLLDDQEEFILRNSGIEDKAKQTSHLRDDSFDREVHKKISEESGGKQMLNKGGEITNVRKFDLGYLGQSDKSETQGLEKELQSRGANQNISDIQFYDSISGRDLRINEVRNQLDDRQLRLAGNIAERVKGLNPEDAKKVLFTASELINDDVDSQPTV